METALLVTAAFIAGALNAVAGGGSFLTLPALVFTGVPPVVANATGTVALLPGYMAGAWGFREDMQPPPGLSMRAVVLLAPLRAWVRLWSPGAIQLVCLPSQWNVCTGIGSGTKTLICNAWRSSVASGSGSLSRS